MKIFYLFICLSLSLAFGQPPYITKLFISLPVKATVVEDHSIARNWNEMLLIAIENDFARPTVHARNLFHSSALMYDLWSSITNKGQPYLLGQTLNDFSCPFTGYKGEESEDALREAISYGMYHLLKHRFSEVAKVSAGLDWFFRELGFDANVVQIDNASRNPVALGNYVASCYIDYGLQDGSNEAFLYTNEYYWPLNEGLNPKYSGNQSFLYPNHWQPLIFEGGFVDQSGNLFTTERPIDFLGAEWGKVRPFALAQNDLQIRERDGIDFWMYDDPGSPPQLGEDEESTNFYLWNFLTVARLSGDLDANNQLIDISPASIGNISVDDLPETFAEYQHFYTLEGGMMGQGFPTNPITGIPYEPNLVPLGDYARVLAEFWADGPSSETPPGHWFTILNYVSDHPAFSPRFMGEGVPLDQLEWDIKAYFTLGGAMHDAAVASWAIKGWYDFPRPISVIRFMADSGQSTNLEAENYAPSGFPLIGGFSELVTPEDPLAGENGEHVGKVKIYAWQGHSLINNPVVDTAGVGWILAENWWPYQRPNFVTPPFAGYISGHSTFSSAAAEVLTYLTGSPYFPGGLGEFVAKKNDFLVFEEGPSVDVVLQWAKYSDAADQTSLSRIWGGIHPPIDDIPGRILGRKIAQQAFELSRQLFDAKNALYR